MIPLEFELSQQSLLHAEKTSQRIIWQIYCPESEEDNSHNSLYPKREWHTIRSRSAYKKQGESVLTYLNRFICGADLLLHYLDSLYVLNGAMSLHFKYYKRKTEQETFKELEAILANEVRYFAPLQIAKKHVIDNATRQTRVQSFLEMNPNLESTSLKSLAMLIRYGKEDDRLLKKEPDSEYVLHYLGYLLTANLPLQKDDPSDEHLDFPDEIHCNPPRIQF